VRFADEYNTPTGDLEEVRRRRARVREACERAGRDPDTLPFSLMTGSVVGADEADVRRRTARMPYVGGSWLVGTPDRIVARLGELSEAGVERVFLQHWEFDDDESIRLLGAEVAPAVA
jgi:alkanesulfonate monooxygenase